MLETSRLDVFAMSFGTDSRADPSEGSIADLNEAAGRRALRGGDDR
jgi:hypothetical protein